MIVASVKGFGPGSVRGLQGLRERRAVRGRLGLDDGVRRRPAARDRRADRRQRHRAAPRARHRRPRSISASRPVRGQKVLAAMQDGVLNLCRVKLRDQQRLDAHRGHEGVSAIPERQVRQRRAARRERLRRRAAGHDRQVQGLGDGSERVSVFHRAGAGVEGDLPGDRQGGVDHRSELRDARMRACRVSRRYSRPSRSGPSPRPSSRRWTCSTSTTSPAGRSSRWRNWPKEPSLRATGTVVEVDHPTRGKYLTVGNPIKMSDSPTEVTRSPLLGEHTDEVLAELGYESRGDRRAAREEGDLRQRVGTACDENIDAEYPLPEARRLC